MTRVRRVLLVILLAAVLGVRLIGRFGDEDDAADKANDTGPSGASAITVRDAWVHAIAGSSGITGAFMIIENSGGAADRLLSAGVSAEIAGAVEIHETTVGEDQAMRMRPVEGVDVPAGGSVKLEPGGIHLMLLDMKRDLTPGGALTLTLTFASGVQLEVSASVRAPE